MTMGSKVDIMKNKYRYIFSNAVLGAVLYLKIGKAKILGNN